MVRRSLVQIYYCLRSGYYDEAILVAQQSRLSRTFAPQVGLRISVIDRGSSLTASAGLFRPDDLLSIEDSVSCCSWQNGSLKEVQFLQIQLLLFWRNAKEWSDLVTEQGEVDMTRKNCCYIRLFVVAGSKLTAYSGICHLYLALSRIFYGSDWL